MTSIHIERGKTTYEADIVGHADYAQEGKDIVCAAVSILVYVLEEEMNNNPDVLVKRFDIQPGLVMVLLEFKDTESVNTVFHLFENGMRMLAENYADYVKFEKVGVYNGSLGVRD